MTDDSCHILSTKPRGNNDTQILIAITYNAFASPATSFSLDVGDKIPPMVTRLPCFLTLFFVINNLDSRPQNIERYKILK